MAYTHEQLEKLGFKKVESKDTGFFDFVNKVTSNVHLVLSPMLEELFIWVLEDGGDEYSDGTKIIINAYDLKKAIKLCEMIVGVDDGF